MCYESRIFDYSEQVCESAVPSAHPRDGVAETEGPFYLEPERYVANDWYRDKGQWFWFSTVSNHAVRNNWYLYKDSGIILGWILQWLKGLQLIKGKPYYFNSGWADGKAWDTVYGTGGQNGVLHFRKKNPRRFPLGTGGISVENGDGREPEHTSPGKTEGKTPALAAYEGSEYTAGGCSLRSPKAGTASKQSVKSGTCPGENEGYRMRVSALIKQFEGCRLEEAYRCAAGVPTIGYGHYSRRGHGDEDYPGTGREAY